MRTFLFDNALMIIMFLCLFSFTSLIVGRLSPKKASNKKTHTAALCVSIVCLFLSAVMLGFSIGARIWE